MVQACGAGDLPLDVPADGGPVELTGGEPTWTDPVDPADALAAVGLGPDDLSGEPARSCGTGLGYVVLPTRPDALARCAPDITRLRRSASGIFVVAWDAATSTARARMFAGDLGTPEDPATGSAATAYGVWLAVTGLVRADGESRYTIRQGIEMGRPLPAVAAGSTSPAGVRPGSGSPVRCSR